MANKRKAAGENSEPRQRRPRVGPTATANGRPQPLPAANYGGLPDSSAIAWRNEEFSLPPSWIRRSPPDNPALGGGGESEHGEFSQSPPTTVLQQPLVNPDGASDAGGVTVTSRRAESRRRFLARRHQAQIGNAHAPQGHEVVPHINPVFLDELALIGNGGQPSSVGDLAAYEAPEQQSSSPAADMCSMCKLPMYSSDPQGVVRIVCDDCDDHVKNLMLEFQANEPQGPVRINDPPTPPWGVYVNGDLYDRAALEQQDAIRAKLYEDMKTVADLTKDKPFSISRR